MSSKKYLYLVDRTTVPEIKETKLQEIFPTQLRFLGIGGVAYRGSRPEAIRPKQEKGFRFGHTYVNAK